MVSTTACVTYPNPSLLSADWPHVAGTGVGEIGNLILPWVAIARNESVTPLSVSITGAKPSDASQTQVCGPTIRPPAGAVGAIPPATGVVRTAAELLKSAVSPGFCAFALLQTNVLNSASAISLPVRHRWIVIVSLSEFTPLSTETGIDSIARAQRNGSNRMEVSCHPEVSFLSATMRLHSLDTYLRAQHETPIRVCVVYRWVRNLRKNHTMQE